MDLHVGASTFLTLMTMSAGEAKCSARWCSACMFPCMYVCLHYGVYVQKHTRGCPSSWTDLLDVCKHRCVQNVQVLTPSVLCVCVLSLQEIANHMEKDTETYEVVQEAIDTMQRVAWHINDMKRKHEHAVRLQVKKKKNNNHQLVSVQTFSGSV